MTTVFTKSKIRVQMAILRAKEKAKESLLTNFNQFISWILIIWQLLLPQ